MKKNRDPNYIIKVEKAIADKYGEEAVQNPKANWDEEKEKKYLKQLKKIAKKQNKVEDKTEKILFDGFLIEKKLINKERNNNRQCPICSAYSFSKRDDLYMNKFECCFKCYIQYVEGREERWQSGWRPDKQGAIK